MYSFHTVTLSDPRVMSAMKSNRSPGMMKNVIGRNKNVRNMSSFEVLLTRNDTFPGLHSLVLAGPVEVSRYLNDAAPAGSAPCTGSPC